MAKGFVYIATNPSYKGYVKIGRAGDLKKRMRTLSSPSGVLEEFKCEFAKKVNNAVKIEKLMHKVFADRRHKSKKEYFKVKLEQAIAALEIAPGRKVKIPTQQQIAPGFPFDEIGIKPNTIITFKGDDTINARVLANNYIRFKDTKRFSNQEMSITAAAQLVRSLKDRTLTKRISGARYWIHKGETLQQRRKRLGK